MLCSSCSALGAASAGQSFAQGTNSQGTHHRSLIFGGSSGIACRSGRGCREIGGIVNSSIIQSVAQQSLFRSASLDGCGSDIGQTDACVGNLAALVERDVSRHAGNRIVTDLAFELEISAAAALAGRGD